MSHPNDSGNSNGGYYHGSSEEGADHSNRFNDYSSYRGGHAGRGYYRGANAQGRYASYGNEADVNAPESAGSHQPYTYNSNYRKDYYYGGRGDNNRYYNGRSNSAHQFYGQSGYRYGQSEHQYNYYGNNRRSFEGYRGGRSNGTTNPRYKSVSKPFTPQESYRYSPRPHDSGNSTPVEQYNRSNSQPRVDSKPVNEEPLVRQTPAASVKKRVEQGESGFFYLTDLDKSSDDPVELARIRDTLREGDQLDRELESHSLQLLKTELELELLNTQCERDALNVQLTQEKLDSLLMQG